MRTLTHVRFWLVGVYSLMKLSHSHHLQVFQEIQEDHGDPKHPVSEENMNIRYKQLTFITNSGQYTNTV